jgi:hypothetical protein
MFGDSVGSEWEAIIRLYVLPGDSAGEEGLPVFGLGGQYSGVAFHTHGAAWAEVIEGGKRWWLAPPGRKPEFNGDRHQLQWALESLPQYSDGLGVLEGEVQGKGYDRLVDEGEGAGKGWSASQESSLQSWLSTSLSTASLLSCELGPGQVLYIPPSWWHATLNSQQYNTFVSTFTRERE